ncbi:MAG: ribbon-helix-helix domain-containing protein [Acidimicrobiia bacterium]|nr:ribbon-helix-helix domain-containing protein [Acidimicrobiia bacterium]
MKLSVSIPEEDVEFLDTYAKIHRISSRSAAVQQAIRLLRASELTEAYAAAFTEWADGDDGVAWDVTTADN